MKDVLVWVHEDCLGPNNPALARFPGARAVFVFDDGDLRAGGMSLKQIVFLYECLLELPVEIYRGDRAATLLALGRECGAPVVVTTRSPAGWWKQTCSELAKDLSVEVIDPPAFLPYDRNLDLKRFSRFWKKVEPLALGGE